MSEFLIGRLKDAKGNEAINVYISDLRRFVARSIEHNYLHLADGHSFWELTRLIYHYEAFGFSFEPVEPKAAV